MQTGDAHWGSIEMTRSASVFNKILNQSLHHQTRKGLLVIEVSQKNLHVLLLWQNIVHLLNFKSP